ncbi:hypothetical protein SNE40_003496 [Patella caerulea]|uniref:Uncharacterized protein n=1 Tax=Patella caerulea TaxID=87958 RepID=A0AAN8KBD2_PATCE
MEIMETDEPDKGDMLESPKSTANAAKSSSSNNMCLPPCRICGEKASGFHYGVNTCEACKGFFRRSLKKKGKYKCFDNQDCKIGPGKRNGCPHCRYEKCLAVGMSKEAIKTGRYTHKKRTQDILEIKKLQGFTDKCILDNLRDDTTSVDSPGSIKDICLESEDPLLSENDNLRLLSDIAIDADLFARDCNTSPASSTSTLEFCSKFSPGKKEIFLDPDKLEEIIQRLTVIHSEHVQCFSAMDYKEVEEKTTEYYEKYKLKTEVFGKLSLLSMEQYKDFYDITGIDIDDRQPKCLQMATTMERCIRRLIAFAKSIPGFTDLSIEDQSNLLKASRFEFFFLGFYRGYNNKIKTVISPAGNCMYYEEVQNVINGDFILKCFKFADSLKKLDLQYDETVILKAIVLLFRDRCELENPDKVEELQWPLVQCLIYLVKKNHPDQPNFFGKIMDRLMEIRTISEENCVVMKHLLLIPAIQKNPLLLEFMSF